jgi:hypothetical protein
MAERTPKDASSQTATFDFKIIRLFRQQPIKVKS